MKRRIRVQRAVGARGYAAGWVVLSRGGMAVSWHARWELAYAFATRYARALERLRA